MENPLGIEPRTDGLKARYSTTELRVQLAGRQGFEPQYAESKSAVLPLDDLPMNRFAEAEVNTLPSRIERIPPPTRGCAAITLMTGTAT